MIQPEGALSAMTPGDKVQMTYITVASFFNGKEL